MSYARNVVANRQLGHLRVYMEQSLKATEVQDSPPPFPILLYFLSVIDLLGALYGGDASSHADYTSQSIDYAVRFMRYSEEQARILRYLVRHKLAHLGMPAPVLLFEDKRITWEIAKSGVTKHLMLEPVIPRQSILVFGTHRLEYDYKFTININALYYDIQMSIDPYLNALSDSATLQERFQKAMAQIFELREYPSNLDTDQNPANLAEP